MQAPDFPLSIGKDVSAGIKSLRHRTISEEALLVLLCRWQAATVRARTPRTDRLIQPGSALSMASTKPDGPIVRSSRRTSSNEAKSMACVTILKSDRASEPTGSHQKNFRSSSAASSCAMAYTERFFHAFNITGKGACGQRTAAPLRSIHVLYQCVNGVGDEIPSANTTLRAFSSQRPTRTSALPKFFPCNRPMKAAGAFSRPSVTSSR